MNSVEDNKPGNLENNIELEPEVTNELSKVATNPKQSIAILVVVCLIFAYIFYSMFFAKTEEEIEENKRQDEVTEVPTNVNKPNEIHYDSNIPSIPQLPTNFELEETNNSLPPSLDDELRELPKSTPIPDQDGSQITRLPDGTIINENNIDVSSIKTPEAQAPSIPTLPNGSAPILPGASITGPISFKTPLSENQRKRLEQKRKAGVMLVSGKVTKKPKEQIEKEAGFVYRGNLNRVLGQGKMIDATIETALNTDFGGEIRAIISRDVYSEQGRNILIQKGSRVFGNYGTDINGAYGRIMIEWVRIDLANGYRLTLSGTGSDALGRKGNQGRVDDKFKERFSNVVLRSAVNVMVAQGLDKLIKPVTSSAAGAKAKQLSNSLITTMSSILSNPDYKEKAVTLCNQILPLITDNTSKAYIDIDTACNNIPNPTEKLEAVKIAITNSANSLTSNTNEQIQKTKAQEAAEKGYEDVGDLIKNHVEEKDFKTTITIDQGTPVKIYVNKDYEFPKSAIKSRILK